MSKADVGVMSMAETLIFLALVTDERLRKGLSQPCQNGVDILAS